MVPKEIDNLGGGSAISFLALPYVIFHGTLHIELFGILISLLLLNPAPTDFYG